MVPEKHEIAFPTTDKLHAFLDSAEFKDEMLVKLRDQYVVEVTVKDQKTETVDGQQVVYENLLLTYTRNNAGGLKDAIDFLVVRLVTHGLDANNVKGSIPRPKSDSFEDSMPYFDSKLLQRAEAPIVPESPTRAHFNDDGDSRSGSIFDKLRKPGSMSSFSSFLDRRKNGSNSPGSLFKHASNNASKASLVSMESRDSGYRNPWNDSGIDLEHDSHTPTTSTTNGALSNGWGSLAAAGSRPATSSASLRDSTYESKFPFGVGNTSTSSLISTPMIPGLGSNEAILHNGGNIPDTRPGTSSSATTAAPAASGYPAPIGPPR